MVSNLVCEPCQCGTMGKFTFLEAASAKNRQRDILLNTKTGSQRAAKRLSVNIVTGDEKQAKE